MDSDKDGLPDSWEFIKFGNLGQTSTGDFDHDGLTNFQEYDAGTNPTNWDTNGNGVPDGLEFSMSYNPSTANGLGTSATSGISIFLSGPKQRTNIP